MGKAGKRSEEEGGCEAAASKPGRSAPGSAPAASHQPLQRFIPLGLFVNLPVTGENSTTMGLPA